MDMITSGKVGVGRSAPDQRDVTGQIYKTYYRRPKKMDWSTRWIGGKKSETEGQLEVRSI